MHIAILLLIVFLVLIGLNLMRHYIQDDKRLAHRLNTLFLSRREYHSQSIKGQRRSSSIWHILKHLSPYQHLVEKLRGVFSKQLKYAGFFTKQSFQYFMIALISFEVLASAAAIIAWNTFPFFNQLPFFATVLSGCIGLSLLGILPKKILDYLGKQYRARFFREFPDFLELFLICLDAGDSQNQALNRILTIFKITHKTSSVQIEILMEELVLLPQRYMAWRNLAERVDIMEVTQVSKIIQQCELLGVPLGEDLRTQAKILRQTQLQNVEKKIVQLSVKLSIPLILFILPALIMIILGPALISISDSPLFS